MREPARGSLAVDLLNPYATGRPERPWLAAFQALLPDPEPVLGEGDPQDPPFDRLTTPAGERVETPHRVSVVVTAYRPDQGLITAVRSILAQTWANVEIVIVDDASPPEYDDLLHRAATLGERIRLVRLAVNSGTYAARNAGLDAAGGEFVAFQDSDDWSHPRRLELQVQPLLADRRLVATTSDGLAVTDQLLLTRPGVRSGRFNPSSLLLRRSVVTGRIGYFDRLRKARRLASTSDGSRRPSACGPVHHLESEPLALIRLSTNSLSRAEIKAHWMHPGRTAYMLGVPALASADQVGCGVAVPAGGRLGAAVPGAGSPARCRSGGAGRVRRGRGRGLAVPGRHAAYGGRRVACAGWRRASGGGSCSWRTSGPRT